MKIEKQSSFQIDRQETMAQLNALEREWTDLVEAIPGTPIFLTWEWIRTWWLYFGRDRELWLLTARDELGRLLGLAPLMVDFHRMGGRKLRVLAFIGSGFVTPLHLNMLVHPSGQDELYQAFINYLLSRSNQWDVICFEALVQDSPLSGLLATAGGHVRVGSEKRAPYVPLPGAWETYLKTVSKKLRRNLKYFRSKLEDDYPGSVRFTCVTDSQTLACAMKKLEEFSRQRWHARGLTTHFDDPTYSSFHQSIASLALDRGWLRLYTLTVMDRMISVFYCFRLKDSVYAYQIGFDLDWSGYSPGRLLIAYGIQEAIQEAASELDWGPGEDDYKYAWTDRVRVENDLLLSSNWRGGLWTKWANLEGGLKMRAKHVLPLALQARLKQFLSRRNKTTENRADRDGG